MYNKLSSAAVLLLGVYLCLSVTSGDATKYMCYNCSSVSDKGCADPMGSNVSMVTCPVDNAPCVKVVYNMQNGTKVTSRGCASLSNSTCDTIKKDINDTKIGNATYCLTCTKDHCNSAVTFGVPLIAMVATFVAARML